MHNALHTNPMCMFPFLPYEYQVTCARRRHSQGIHHVDVRVTQSMALRDAFGYRFVRLFHVGLLCYSSLPRLCKANIGLLKLLAVHTENNISYDKPR